MLWCIAFDFINSHIVMPFPYLGRRFRMVYYAKNIHYTIAMTFQLHSKTFILAELVILPNSIMK